MNPSCSARLIFDVRLPRNVNQVLAPHEPTRRAQVPSRAPRRRQQSTPSPRKIASQCLRIWLFGRDRFR